MYELPPDELRGWIAEADYDNVGLWEIIFHLREGSKINDLATRRAYTIEIVRQLLATNEIVAAQYRADRSGNYDLWNLDTDAVIARIQSEWNQLAREPSVGEIVLFISKKKVERMRK
jgi:hypothetical protein